MRYPTLLCALFASTFLLGCRGLNRLTDGAAMSTTPHDPIALPTLAGDFPNKSFEQWANGAPTGWEVGFGGHPVFTLAPSNDAHDGGLSAHYVIISTAAGTDNIRLIWKFDVSKYKGHHIKFTGWFKTTNPDRWVMTLKWGLGNKYSPHAVGTGSWESVSVETDIPDNAPLLWITLGQISQTYQDGDEALLDDVRMEVVP